MKSFNVFLSYISCAFLMHHHCTKYPNQKTIIVRIPQYNKGIPLSSSIISITNVLRSITYTFTRIRKTKMSSEIF